jgi:hypothetical protein
MPLVLTPKAVKIAVDATVEGETCTNLFHAINNTNVSAPTFLTMGAIVSAFFNAWEARVLPPLSHTYVLELVTATYLGDIVTPTASLAGPAPGGDASSPLPLQCAAVVKWNIASRYRGGHPRSYLPGITDGSTLDRRTLTSAAVTALQLAMTEFAGDVNLNLPTGWEFGTVHRFGPPCGALPNAQCVAPSVEVIGGPIVDSVLGTQRRRLHR